MESNHLGPCRDLRHILGIYQSIESYTKDITVCHIKQGVRGLGVDLGTGDRDCELEFIRLSEECADACGVAAIPLMK